MLTDKLKIQIGPFTFPSCLLPNCTVDFHCGNGSRSPSPPSSLAPILPPSKNLFSPCGVVWCGDGTCVTNGTGYACQCNQGSENLLNSSNLACFKTCYFGADCSSLGFNLPSVPRPQISQPPPSSSPSSASKGPLKLDPIKQSIGSKFTIKTRRQCMWPN
ncbi:hypothetical protein SLEP1_g43990 [Rubroshorea leprosula]|uniref:EGF-like domain-containing protein n=1 Tax=Rubroshorea leprosula TaxID=152421 RepID=A0AAV5LET9_9ROSI|nr:hypothetical protein SLEP1_g43990 [Rubroshorea leprosula]